MGSLSEQAALELLEVAQRVAGDPTRFAGYAEDPAGFCRDVLGVQLWSKQLRLLEAARDHRRVAVRSGHSVGKTMAAACLILWWLYGRQGLVVSTAPTKKHLFDALWREVHQRARSARVPLPGEFNKADIVIDPTWTATAVTTDEPGAFQGRHHPRLLIIGDEAVAISEQTHLEMDTCASGLGNRIVLIGNPTVTAGTFYEAFRRPDLWHTFKISCFEHPNVVQDRDVIPGAITKVQVERWRRQWGEQHPFWYPRVLGDFPAISTRGVIPLAWIERAQNDERRQAALGAAAAAKERRVAGLDVARYGDNKCVFVVRVGDAVEQILEWHHVALTETAGRAQQLVKELKVAELIVDAAGLGAGVYDILVEQGVRVSGYNGGHRAFNNGAYSNRRCEMWWHLRQRFERQRLWLPEKGLEVEQLVADLVTPQYEVVSTGRIKIETKEKLLERGVKSPDFADALSLCFALELDPEEALQPPTPREADSAPALEALLEQSPEPFPNLGGGF